MISSGPVLAFVSAIVHAVQPMLVVTFLEAAKNNIGTNVLLLPPGFFKIEFLQALLQIMNNLLIVCDNRAFLITSTA